VPNAFDVIYHGALCHGTTGRRSTLKVYISFHTSHLNLGFYFGASLPDKDGLLEGESTPACGAIGLLFAGAQRGLGGNDAVPAERVRQQVPVNDSRVTGQRRNPRYGH